MLVPGAEKDVVCIDSLWGLNGIDVDLLRKLPSLTLRVKETLLRLCSEIELEMLVAEGEKDAVCIDDDAMFNCTGSSCDCEVVSDDAWRLRTGVPSSSSKETFVPSIVLQGGNSVEECFLVLLQCSFSVRVEIVLLLWHNKQASSVLSISLKQHPWPGFSQNKHSPTLLYLYKLKKLLY